MKKICILLSLIFVLMCSGCGIKMEPILEGTYYSYDEENNETFSKAKFIIKEISKEEYETANKVYSLINDNYKDYEPLLDIKASIDADSYSLVELVKEAKSMGVTKPEEIVVLLIDEN